MKIKENQKVTLTLGQLRRLIKEAGEKRSPMLLKRFKRWAKYLLNVNPKYVTDPGRLIPYLKGPNWDDPDMEYAHYRSTIRACYGDELCDFFEKLRGLPDDEAAAEYLSLLRDSGVKTDDALDEEDESVWMGDTECDFCHKECGKNLYDGKTDMGPWAVMCDKCFRTHGVGLGAGRGQKYKKVGDDYVKVPEKKSSRKNVDDETARMFRSMLGW